MFIKNILINISAAKIRKTFSVKLVELIEK